MTATATPSPPTHEKPPRWPAIVAALVFFVVAFVRAVGPPADYPRDFFIYRLGSQLAIHGENPYDIPKTRQHVADNFPIDDGEKLLLNSVHLTSGDFASWLVPAHGTLRKSFPLNCGYFMPPMSVVLYAPFAMLPWVPAMILWAIVNGIAAYIITRLPMLLLTPGGPAPSPFLATIVPFLLVLNPIAPIIVFPAGQTSVVFLAFVVAGLMAYERGRVYLMAALWGAVREVAPRTVAVATDAVPRRLATDACAGPARRLTERARGHDRWRLTAVPEGVHRLPAADPRCRALQPGRTEFGTFELEPPAVRLRRPAD
ncbi:MAG: glycosyltransferase family 87 protein [Gemmataceae bacterium]